MITQDARGLSCPQPVIATKTLLASLPTEAQIIVDNFTAKENVMRFAENAGYIVKIDEKENDFYLTFKKAK